MHCKQFVSLSVASLMLAAVLTGCGGASSTASSAVSSEAASAVSAAAASESTEAALPDGVYTAEFDTDSGMFHANEACNGMGTLTVENGQMTFHVSLASKKIVNLYVGMAADAEANKADWLLPTTDTVTYSDGTSEEVYGYDIPVAAVDQDFQLALLGTKGKWYDHTVSIRNAQPKTEEAAETPADGEYSVNVTLEGGSGRATVESPAALTVADGKMTAVILWSSPNYDYMIVDGEKYLPTNTEGNSTFEIPVSAKVSVYSISWGVLMATVSAVTASAEELVFDHACQLDYAKQFTADCYEGGYTMLTLTESGEQFLVTPEDAAAVEGLPESVTVLRQPIRNIYLVSTSVMDLFLALDGLDSVTLSGTRAEGWYLDEARAAMEDGRIAYAGKYSAPDYEKILAANCGLAIENTMIYHTPEVKEQLERFGIPVLVERSSYESGPLARLEWLKFWGILLGKEELAEQEFARQVERLAPLAGQASTGKRCAFFSITANNLANVRKGGDYVAQMIEMAGGDYVFADLTDNGNNLSTMNLPLEDFYAGAKDADVLLYNSTIEGVVHTTEELVAKCPLLAEFKALQSGSVWCTTQSFFQQSTALVDFVLDLHRVFTENDPADLQFLRKVE